MKKLVLVVLLEQFADWEAAYVNSFLLALGRDRFSLKTVSLTKEAIHSIGGLTVLPDYDIASAPMSFDGLILIGGMTWRMENAKQVAPLVQHAVEEKKVLGGICDAAGFLGTLGVLNHIPHTGNAMEDIQKWAGEAYQGQAFFKQEQAVRADNIVTANGTAAIAFAGEMLAALDIASADVIDQWTAFYQLGPFKAPMPSVPN